MGQSTPLDANHVLTQIKYAIKGLTTLANEDEEDDVLYAVNKLITVVRIVHDHHQAWNSEAIREFVLHQHDPLRHITVKSATLHHRVRDIQHHIIGTFS